LQGIRHYAATTYPVTPVNIGAADVGAVPRLLVGLDGELAALRELVAGGLDDGGGVADSVVAASERLTGVRHGGR
jgi:hypothetical protein